MVVGGSEVLPADTEARLASFTELVATAVANAESRAELARLADEQAALRRIATLVARGLPPEHVFEAVTQEVGRLLVAEMSNMVRYEPDGSFTIVGSVGSAAVLRKHWPVGSRWPLGGNNTTTLVFETARPARIDTFGEHLERVHEVGFRSAVGVPIIVEGRLWGVIGVATTQAKPLPADTEDRLSSFTELVATAIANAESRAALAASRVRIVAAADESRRRIERDLHDGAQQRLAHGILPAALTRGGLRAGVEALVSRVSLPVSVDVRVERLPAGVEATAYFRRQRGADERGQACSRGRRRGHSASRIRRAESRGSR